MDRSIPTGSCQEDLPTRSLATHRISAHAGAKTAAGAFIEAIHSSACSNCTFDLWARADPKDAKALDNNARFLRTLRMLSSSLLLVPRSLGREESRKIEGGETD
mmetsp:Transcript_26529/g.87139  ORF Transcript_26529/g.87139 Transcript_26529/m.87139 type:complete len:104 (+) Transcript_26529:733-1044(+)